MRRDDERLTERDRDTVGRAADIRRKYHVTAQDNQRAPVEHSCDARALERTGTADDSDGESASG
ncbi:MAG TPA: hypothetical protein VKQ07_06500 [Jatrophihabitantaceae bacterium]|nr:hypothetical protein [Jatrophihabitantaceae bacterium]